MKNQFRVIMLKKKNTKNKIDGENRKASEVSKPTIERKIKDLTDEIQQTKIDLIGNKIQTSYHRENTSDA